MGLLTTEALADCARWRRASAGVSTGCIRRTRQPRVVRAGVEPARESQRQPPAARGGRVEVRAGVEPARESQRQPPAARGGRVEVRAGVEPARESQPDLDVRRVRGVRGARWRRASAGGSTSLSHRRTPRTGGARWRRASAGVSTYDPVEWLCLTPECALASSQRGSLNDLGPDEAREIVSARWRRASAGVSTTTCRPRSTTGSRVRAGVEPARESQPSSSTPAQTRRCMAMSTRGGPTVAA